MIIKTFFKRDKNNEPIVELNGITKIFNPKECRRKQDRRNKE